MLLYFLDIETTGLDPETDLILEVSVAVYDTKNRQIIGTLDSTVKQAPDWHKYLNKYTRKMHEDSGLLLAVDTGSPQDLLTVEDNILCLVDEFATDDVPILAGNSIHFDRSFIKYQMPRLHQALHYRMVDCTSILLFVEACTGSEIGLSPSKHRAHGDVRRSIETYDACAEMVPIDAKMVLENQLPLPGQMSLFGEE